MGGARLRGRRFPLKEQGPFPSYPSYGTLTRKGDSEEN
jgi:hypothetical protein